jgi:type II secretory pathway pseudopilin PulG
MTKQPDVLRRPVHARTVSLTDTLENGSEPNPRVRWLVGALVVVVLAAAVVVTLYRSAQRRQERADFDRLLVLAAAGQASVERAQSQARDVAQYAEPFLNSPTTPNAVRESLYVTVSTSARQGQTDIESQRQRVAAAATGNSGRLRTAKNAMLAYLSSWSSVYASASGATQSQAPDDIAQELRAARLALVKAAPDRKRVLKANAVLGTTG